jgi:hypothetical protein
MTEIGETEHGQHEHGNDGRHFDRSRDPESDAAEKDAAPRRRQRVALEHERRSGHAEEVEDRLEQPAAEGVQLGGIQRHDPAGDDHRGGPAMTDDLPDEEHARRGQERCAEAQDC